MQALLGRFGGLQSRFLLVVVISALLFAAVAAVGAYSMAHDRALEDGRTTLDGLVRAVEKTASIGAFAGDKVLLQEVIDGLGRHPLVARVVVRSPDGALLAERRSGAPIETNPRMAIERPLVSPFSAAEAVGSLRIEANAALLQAGAKDEAIQLAAIMIGQIVLVASLLYVVAAWLVSKPIELLAARLGTMQPGTPERLVLPRLHRHDEIGTLIGGANTLLGETEAALDRERALRAEVEAMEAQYRQIFDATSAGIFVLDIEGRLINGNPTVMKVIGAPVLQIQQMRGRDFLRQVFARPDQVQALVTDAASRRATVSSDLELLTRGGHSRWVHCLISVQGRAGAPADAAFVEGVMYDVTDRKLSELAVQHRADHDLLTGLKNRASSDATIDRLLAEAAVSRRMLTLLFIDLDGFKAVNDTFGHAAGDRVLQVCAQCMRGSLRRASDLAGRIGGDEFVIALAGVGAGDLTASRLAADLLERLQEPIELDDGQIAFVGASIGLASYPFHGEDRAQLAAMADLALYEVKRHGKNAFAMAWTPPPMTI